MSRQATLGQTFRSLFRSTDSWFDCDSVILDVAGTKIVSFVDQLDRTHVLTQASSALQVAAPTKDMAFNGARTAKATGAQYYVSNRAANTWNFLHDGTGCTVLVIAKWAANDTTNQGILTTSGSTSGNPGIYIGKSAGVDNLRAGRNGTTAYAVDINVTPTVGYSSVYYLSHTVSPSPAIYGNTTGRGNYSLSTYSNSPVTTDAATTLTLFGRNPASPSNLMSGTVAAVYIWKRVLTVNERAIALQYCRAKYGLQPWHNFTMGICTYHQSDFIKSGGMGFKFVRTDNPNATKIQQIRDAGLEVLPIARYTLGEITNASQIPAWVAGKLALWSGVTPAPVVIECVNEPWNAGYSDFTTNYSLYVQLVTEFCNQAWAIWPNIKILVCGDTGPIAGWLDNVLAADTNKIMADTRIRPSVHTYTEARTPQEATGGAQYSFGRYIDSYNKFKAHGHPNPLVWVTEFGWESDTPGSTVVTTVVTEALQSKYTIEGAEILRCSGIVEAAFVFGMMQSTTPAYNLIRPTGTDKPVVAALTSYMRGHIFP